MLISNEKKVVIGKVKYFFNAKEFEDRGYIIADDDIIDRIYDVYEKYKKLGHRKIAFDRFCINYFKGDYNYSIRKGWEKYE